jgi:hypothetical protein
MTTTAERKAYQDGYGFTGVWERSYNRDEAKRRAAEFRAEGFLARLVDTDGGVAVYTKDTPKTLEAKAEKERQDELKRLERAAEVAAYLTEVAGQLKDMKLNVILSIQNEVRRIIERGF